MPAVRGNSKHSTNCPETDYLSDRLENARENGLDKRGGSCGGLKGLFPSATLILLTDSRTGKGGALKVGRRNTMFELNQCGIVSSGGKEVMGVRFCGDPWTHIEAVLRAG